MAFSFAPAPATTPAAAPASGGLSFGTSSAPVPTFGATPTASPSSLFGTGSAPAPAFGAAAPTFGVPSAAPTSLFGAPTAAPTSGFSAPSTGFGSAPAPTAGSNVFGGTASTPAPAFATAARASTGNLFGSTSAAGVPGAPQTAALSGQTPYAMLPPDAKRAVDNIHDQMMRHRRAMIQVQTMAPALLRDTAGQAATSSPADKAAGVGSSGSVPLLTQVVAVQSKVDELIHQFEKCRTDALTLRQLYETSVAQAVMFGKWPMEALAARRGVKLSPSENKADHKVQNDLRMLLEQRAASVDRVERMPSPYMWEILQDFETRLVQLQSSIQAFHSHVIQSQKATQQENVSGDWIRIVVQQQSEALRRVAVTIGKLHEQMNQVRLRYRHYEKGENVLDKADLQENERERHIEEQMRVQFVNATPSAASAKPALAAGVSAPAPGLFGAASTPAPATGLFGAASTPAPATGLFGAASTPAPATGLFGATPAPAFGTTQTPAPSAFGATQTPAPGAFGAAPATPSLSFATTNTASITRSKSKNRSRNRR